MQLDLVAKNTLFRLMFVLKKINSKYTAVAVEAVVIRIHASQVKRAHFLVLFQNGLRLTVICFPGWY